MLKFKILEQEESTGMYYSHPFSLDLEVFPIGYYKGVVINDKSYTEVVLYNGDVITAEMTFNKFDKLYIAYLELCSERLIKGVEKEANI